MSAKLRFAKRPPAVSVFHFPEAWGFKPGGDDDCDGHAASEYDGRNDAHQFGHDAAFELAQLVAGIDEHGIDGRDPAAHGVRSFQLHDGPADDDADAVHHPAAHESEERK